MFMEGYFNGQIKGFKQEIKWSKKAVQEADFRSGLGHC